MIIPSALTTLVLHVAPSPPLPSDATVNYFNTHDTIACIIVAGFLLGILLRLIPFYKHIDPLLTVSLYIALPTAVYIAATGIGVSLQTHHWSLLIVRGKFIWPFYLFCLVILAGKYTAIGARRLSRAVHARQERDALP